MFSPSKAKIALPLQNEPVPVGSLSLISGWGRFSYGGGSPISLRAAKVNIVNQALCNRAYNGGITTRMLCAAAKGKDACQGWVTCDRILTISLIKKKCSDSGGPLKSSNNKLIGVVSFGMGCAMDRYPGVYSRVAFVRDWIKKISGV